MAINDNGNGKNKFDPSKKVREVLGNDFVDSTENEALERLSQASKTAVRNNTVYNEDMGMSPKDILGKIQHSTLAGQQQHHRLPPAGSRHPRAGRRSLRRRCRRAGSA